jgi:hypothetical protein
MNAPEFTVEVFQNPYLASGAREVSAIVTVTAESVGTAQAAAASAAEIIIVDCSGSMSAPAAKLAQARHATSVAVDAIHDGTAFAVVVGANDARPLYPVDGTLAVADARTKDEARHAVSRLQAAGGTAIGQWLRLAREIFLTRPDELRHAILLTDGQNAHETLDELAAAIAACTGVFSCDCRGVGTDWEVAELRKISAALLGTVDIVPDPAGLAADFEALINASMAKEVAGVSLRLWTPQHTVVRFVKQVAPTVEDLTSMRRDVTAQAGDYPTGAWSAGESRDYHVSVAVQPGGVDEEMLAARVSVVQDLAAGAQTLGQGQLIAIWTDDVEMSTRISPEVAHYTGQEKLHQAIQDGLAAKRQGDVSTAERRLGDAVAIAHESGNQEQADRLASVVDVIDPATGTVRLKNKVVDADEMALDTRSTKTLRVRKQQPLPPTGPQEPED